MVSSTNVYVGIFYPMYLLPRINIPFLNWCSVILVMLYLAAGSPQYIFQDMKNYFVIVLMKLSSSKTGDKLIHNSICIISWKNMCIVSIR